MLNTTLRIIRIIIITTFVLWVLGLFYFYKITHNTNPYDRRVTDAIVVFDNEQSNIMVGTQLLTHGYAPLIFMVGATVKQQFKQFFFNHHLLSEQFIFDEELDEYVNSPALNIALFLHKYRLSSTRLVIDSIQLPRALLELNTKLTRNITIVPHPVIHTSQDYKLLLAEYIKYIALVICYFFGYYDISLSY